MSGQTYERISSSHAQSPLPSWLQLAVSVNYFLLKLTPVTNQSLTSAHEPAHREYLSPESEDSSWLGTGEGREDEWSGQLITDLTFYTWDPSLLVTKLIHLEQFP